MEKQMKEEIEKYAEIIGITVDEASAVFDSIVEDNSLDIENEEGLLVARSVFRSKFAQTKARIKKEETGEETVTTEYTGPTFTQKAKGFFWAVENATDWEERNRNTLLAEYQRDADSVLQAGKAAMAVQLSDGRYEVTLVLEGDPKTRLMEKLPETEPMQVDDDRWLIPVDTRKAWGSGQENPSYGKPLPASRWQRTLMFIGTIGDGEISKYQLRVNGEQARDFHPRTFALCEFDCVPNSNNPSNLSARKDGSTVNSLSYVDEEMDILNLIQETLGEKISALIALDSYHSDNSHKPYSERIVITDGNVANMNLQPYDNGNRVIYLSDLNADFDYEGEGFSSTACWVPSNIEIDFGIGSNIIVVGRTSQREVDGVLSNVSINVLGLYVVDRHGSADVSVQPVEGDDYSWF
tara:strand:- start:3692 stop:4918 length:1227 start_codon:yes stop_codon:yes gene_type:complete